ncbi:MAG: class I SAM-dependent methyltransferase, partial [Acidithiobacillus sp.]
MEDQGQAFYAAFEDRFRGSFELIYSRLQQYLPNIREIFQNNPEDAALDLGCGRGEWLQVLRSVNIRGFGV